MRYIILILILYGNQGFSQVRTQKLDIQDLQNWTKLANNSPIINSSGDYVCYGLADGVESNDPVRYLVKGVDGKWSKELSNLTQQPVFSKNRKAIIYHDIFHKLYFQSLGRNESISLSGVKGYKLVKSLTNEKLTYTSIDSKDFTILDLKTFSRIKYVNVIDCFFINNESSVILIKNTDDLGYEIVLVSLETNQSRIFWKGINQPSNIIVSEIGEQVAFLADNQLWLSSKGLWARKLHLEINENGREMKLIGPDRFSPSGNLLFLNLKNAVPELGPSNNTVVIQSYQDYTTDFLNPTNPIDHVYSAIYDINNAKYIRITDDFQRVAELSPSERKIIVYTAKGTGVEFYWNKTSKYALEVLDLDSESKVKVDSLISIVWGIDENFIYGQKDFGGDVYSLNLASGYYCNLTQALLIPKFGEDLNEQIIMQKSRGLNFVNWTKDNRHFIVKDRYDYWLIDAKKVDGPKNLTNGFGRQFKVQLEPIEQNKILEPNEVVIMSGFNEETKENGFYSVSLNSKIGPKELHKGPYVYTTQVLTSMKPLKASNKNVWLVKRESAKESPNLYVTTNYKTFQKVSEINPEKQYNWLSTQQISFRTRDGADTQAILYKPDNFDAKKKYPVLFFFYEKEGLKLNVFKQPNFSQDGFSFNIPLMLSEGYLVCVPDIHFRNNNTARNIVQSLEGAADELSKRPYVDSANFGACGGSFSGYGINCLAAFSRKFKALVSVSGSCDLISKYGNVPGNRDEQCENRQYRMGISLATDPEKYLQNSPIAYIKDVKSPILIFNTLADYNVNVQQGIEWFISLRREGKPAWMLTYRSEPISHGIPERDRKDFCLRIKQFFGHYLKDDPTPQWMMDILPIWKRSGEEGFKLTDAGIVPGAGLNSDEDLERTRKYLETKNKKILNK